MAKKIRLGLNLFFNNLTNSGIVNYIYNVVSALNTLPDTSKPHIVVFYDNNAPIDYIKEINYPGIKFIKFRSFSPNKLVRKANNLLKRFSGKDIYQQLLFLNKIDVLYPYFEFNDTAFEAVKHKVHWLVDFNNCAYPMHYEDDGSMMRIFQENLTSRTDHLVLSSCALLDEMKRYYPAYKNKVSVLRFASSLPEVINTDINELQTHFGLTKPYFMSPNQFWEHKNQLAVIEALGILKKRGPLEFQVVFTGSMEVNRGKGHMLSKLLEAVNNYELEDNVKFLGIIDRNHQIALMKNAVALIQPSLYEGWSTLVEEAKALNKKIILSDIPVHREQNCVNSYFFDPNLPQQLAGQMDFVFSNLTPENKIDYAENIKNFGNDLLAMLKNECYQ